MICGPFYGQHANFKSFNSWSFNGDTESEIVDETEIFFVLFKTLIMGFDSNRPRWKPEEEGNDTCKVLSLFCPKRQRIEYKRMEFLGSLLLLLPDDGKFKRQVDDDVVARPNNTQRPLCSERVGTCNGTFSFSFLNFFCVCVDSGLVIACRWNRPSTDPTEEEEEEGIEEEEVSCRSLGHGAITFLSPSCMLFFSYISPGRSVCIAGRYGVPFFSFRWLLFPPPTRPADRKIWNGMARRSFPAQDTRQHSIRIPFYSS